MVLCALLIALMACAAQGQYREAYQSGQSLLRAGKSPEAGKEFERAMTLAATPADRISAEIGVGVALDAGKDFPAARAEFGRALIADGATSDQKAEARCRIGMAWYNERQYSQARAELEKVTAWDEAPATWKAQAALFIGHSWWRENKYPEARAAYARALEVPGLSLAAQAGARLAIVNVFFAEKRYADARPELLRVLDLGDIPSANKVSARISLGKSWFFEGNWAAGREELVKVAAMPDVRPESAAEALLYVGLCDYEAHDYARAREELDRVRSMPGATEKQAHEATLRLRLRKLVPGDEKYLAVLFIGASHTQGWDIPRMVETLAASAPAGSPRIIAGEYLRGGTRIRHFWEEGEGLGTARAKIIAEPWDFVVFESYPFLFGPEESLKYVTAFSDLIRARKAVPVLLDAPAFFRVAYPAEVRKNHDDNVALGKSLRIPVAAAGHAWTLYLGPTPTPAQRMALYHPDAVHTSPKGAYMLACSVYSAITRRSPIGLTRDIPGFAPGEISADESVALQTAAWNAYRESNPVE